MAARVRSTRRSSRRIVQGAGSADSPRTFSGGRRRGGGIAAGEMDGLLALPLPVETSSPQAGYEEGRTMRRARSRRGGSACASLCTPGHRSDVEKAHNLGVFAAINLPRADRARRGAGRGLVTNPAGTEHAANDPPRNRMARPTTLGLLCLALIVGSAGASPRRPPRSARIGADRNISRVLSAFRAARSAFPFRADLAARTPPRTSRPPPSRRRKIAMERRRRIHVYLPRASRSPRGRARSRIRHARAITSRVIPRHRRRQDQSRHSLHPHGRPGWQYAQSPLTDEPNDDSTPSTSSPTTTPRSYRAARRSRCSSASTTAEAPAQRHSHHGSLNLPNMFSFHVTNFTVSEYLSIVEPGKEASFEYRFELDPSSRVTLQAGFTAFSPSLGQLRHHLLQRHPHHPRSYQRLRHPDHVHVRHLRVFSRSRYRLSDGQLPAVKSRDGQEEARQGRDGHPRRHRR